LESRKPTGLDSTTFRVLEKVSTVVAMRQSKLLEDGSGTNAAKDPP
jgi:hypothetical protein